MADDDVYRRRDGERGVRRAATCGFCKYIGPWLPSSPLELAYLVSQPIADLFFLLWRSKREAACRNYARILHVSADDPRARTLAQASFRQFGRYIAELLSVQGWDLDDLRSRVTIYGDEHFQEAASYGRGVIFASAHMGSIEVASALLLLHGLRVTSVMEQLRPFWLHRWMVACRARMGVTLLPTMGTGLKLVRALRRGEVVAMVLDLGVRNGDGRPVTFFGHKTYFPTGPARLARLSGAPLSSGWLCASPKAGSSPTSAHPSSPTPPWTLQRTPTRPLSVSCGSSRGS